MRRRAKAGPLIGAHVSVAGGIWRAPDRAREIGARVAQVFVKNNLQWKAGPLEEPDLERFHRGVAQAGLLSVAAHACYLINLAASDRALWKRSIEAMIDELGRCRLLGVKPLVVHPGSPAGESDAWAVRRIARALDIIFGEVGRDSPIALELTAGQGRQIGHRFEHLRDIMGCARDASSIRVCLDTCHLFAAGYDIGDARAYEETMNEFQQILGQDSLALLHVNDSKQDLGSRIDRHENIGRGRIGLAGFSCVMNDPRLHAIPKILETPKGKKNYWDRRNLGVLRRLVRNTGAGRIAASTSGRQTSSFYEKHRARGVMDDFA